MWSSATMMVGPPSTRCDGIDCSVGRDDAAFRGGRLGLEAECVVPADCVRPMAFSPCAPAFVHGHGTGPCFELVASFHPMCGSSEQHTYTEAS